VLLGIVAVYELVILVGIIGPQLGEDRLFSQAIGERWLSGQPIYLAHQLAGPYQVTLQVDNLYPPSALLLFVPFVFLPAFLWWLIPIGITGYVVASWRPAWWTWPLMALLIVWPKTISSVLWGNTDMWAVAAVAAGLRWGWPALFLLAKPTLAPFALVGVRSRAFWVVGAAMVIWSIVMLPLWLDYFTAMRHLRIPWDYSLGSIPSLFLPIVAWVGRTRLRVPAIGSASSSDSTRPQTAAVTSDGLTARAPSS
jgi:hypothetical protein